MTVLLVSFPALADKDHHHGKGWGQRKYEWDDGVCKYEFKAKGNQIKEERKCRGYSPGPTYVMPAPGYYYAPTPPVMAAPPSGGGMIGCNRGLVGGVLGGAAGGLVGSRIGEGNGRAAATVGGIVLGALLGGTIGRSMDQADLACVGQALEYGPADRPLGWTSPAGHSYQVTPFQAYESDGRTCRPYKAYAQVDGVTQEMSGTACRLPDGTWRKAD